MRVLVKFYGLTLEGAKRALFGQDKQNEESWHVQCPRYGSLEGLDEFVKSLNNTHFVDIRIRSNGKYYWTDGDWIKGLRGMKPVKKEREHAGERWGMCDDCGTFQTLLPKSDHHGGTKIVCLDREACHDRGG
jgi:hypothetical protein